jgi:hypothetical protein
VFCFCSWSTTPPGRWTNSPSSAWGWRGRLHAESENAEGAALCALTEAFCDVSRSIRQSIALSLRIRNGAFAAERAPPRDETERERPDDAERGERAERPDCYERPDWNLPGLARDEPVTEEVLAAAVARIRCTYGKAEALLARSAHKPPPALRLVDTS